MYDLVIIGAGTAGMTAAVYGRRAGREVLVLEEKVYGGQIISAVEVENYPGIPKVSGYDFAEQLFKQAQNLGAEFRYERAEKIIDQEGEKIVVTGRQRYQARTVILATGAKNRPLGVEREEELTGKGVSYCSGGCDLSLRLLPEGVCDSQKSRVPRRGAASGGTEKEGQCRFSAELSGYRSGGGGASVCGRGLSD